MESRVKKIHDLGQSIWLDFFDREIIYSGKLQQLITEDGLSGVTSNPAIFEKAISSSDDYNDDIGKYSENNSDFEDVFYQIAVGDIQKAADLFKPVYEQAGGTDGFVSLEVSPHLAMDTQGTINQALKLWKAAGRENVMIKIPATVPGLEAIQTCLQKGININITLLFGLDRYRAVAEAYISALENRIAQNEPVDHISSVASFFLSRIDVLIDPMLEQKGLKELQGEVAIASAKKAYQIYKEAFSGPRWQKLAEAGAKPQRLLWASTSSKNPAFKATKYVDALIGPETVNTVPVETLEAYRKEGDPESRLENNLSGAAGVLNKLKEAGIDIDKITMQLEQEGIEKFNVPYDKLINAIKDQVANARKNEP